jgi:ABC-type sugar transport system ATPase subunit
MNTLLEMRGISKSFFGVEVLHKMDFDLRSGEVVALCGENGAGKSTLMKILAAVYERNEGTITLFGKNIPHMTPRKMLLEGVSMIHQELNLLDDLTVAQNIFLTREPHNKLGFIDFKKMNKDAKALLERLGQSDIKPTAKLYSLKMAQKQMVEIAKAISFDVKVIIMDEPTAVLTLKETEILFDLIKTLTARGIGIVYVTHRLSEVKTIADRVTVLRDGYLVATKNVVDVTENDIATMMVGREVEHTVPDEFAGDPGNIVLEVRNITGDILKNVSFSVAKGEILGFSGLVGAGRSELMEMIFGLRKFEQGEILLYGKPVTIKRARTAIHAGLGFATENRKESGLVLLRSIAENTDLVLRIKKNDGFVLFPRSVRYRVEKMISRLRIVCRGPGQLAKNLSGGNQQKVVLAKWLLADSEIFIVDEPTRGIDVGARAEIYHIIKELTNEGKTIIMVSSDMTEVLSICQRIIVMHEGKITGVLSGEKRTEHDIMQHAINIMEKEAV